MKPNEKLLRVMGPRFCGGAVFRKVEGRWVLVDCAPYLRAVIGKTPVEKIGERLKQKGFGYEWL